MEYAEAINEGAAERAFAIALRLRAAGVGELHEITVQAVASAYCVCVTDGEDSVEHGLSPIHAGLIDDLEQRLATHIQKLEDR
jgi:hypothetical protein